MMDTLSIFALRRNHLMAQLEVGSVVILASGREIIRNGDVHYPFRPNSDFYYLTGFMEPDAFCLLTAKPAGHDFILFTRPHDPTMEIWNGKRAGIKGAIDTYGAHKAYSCEEFNSKLPSLLANTKRLYYKLGLDEKMDESILGALNALKKQARLGVSSPDQICHIDPILSEARLFKTEQELALMKKAIDVSVNAHKAVMKATKPAKKEYEMEAVLLYEFLKEGCRAPAYPSIVAAGANGCVLHYIENQAELVDGDLLLVDAGAEYQGYAADITRTFPINGKFSPSQKQIYELVLKSQQAIINMIKPGVLWNQLQETAVSVLTEGLVELGLLTGPVDTLIKENAYRKFYMHSSGHWLGLDVHDAGSYKINGQWRPLMPGMVLTVEPGLYISSEHTELDPQWLNIGVRIEDDVLVTETGCEVLSKNAPKTISEIEALMSGSH